MDRAEGNREAVTKQHWEIELEKSQREEKKWPEKYIAEQ